MSVSLTGADRYIRVRRANGQITYGGDQGFFAKETVGRQERKRSSGCGAVAFGDLLLYLAAKKSSCIQSWNKSYVNRILEEKQYVEYAGRVFAHLGFLPKAGYGGLQLAHGFNKAMRRSGSSLRAKWGWSGEKLFSRIMEMLQKDIPVILCIPQMVLPKEKKDSLAFYTKEQGSFCFQKSASVTAHYVVVTEWITDPADETGYFRISSWGKEYYVNWKEYEAFMYGHFLGTLLGNILYIR